MSTFLFTLLRYYGSLATMILHLWDIRKFWCSKVLNYSNKLSLIMWPSVSCAGIRQTLRSVFVMAPRSENTLPDRGATIRPFVHIISQQRLSTVTSHASWVSCDWTGVWRVLLWWHLPLWQHSFLFRRSPRAVCVNQSEIRVTQQEVMSE